MTNRDTRLDSIRRLIDALDAELLDLLNRRGRAVLDVAAVKGREVEPRYYRPEREAALLRRLSARNEGPLPAAEVTRLFREIVSTCRALEQRLAIGCTTVEEACAALGHFGGAVDIRAAAQVVEALDAVAAGHCHYAVIAFLQSDGASPVVADLPERGLALCGEWYARGGERFVVIGCESSPPSGDDWTSCIVPTQCVEAIASWCDGSNVRMRATRVAGRESTIVDVAVDAGEPRLARLVTDLGGVVLGGFPNAGAGTGPR